MILGVLIKINLPGILELGDQLLGQILISDNPPNILAPIQLVKDSYMLKEYCINLDDIDLIINWAN